MMEFPQFITKLVNQKVIHEQTLVIDSLSIYAARVLRELRLNNPGQDNRQRYGELADALSAQIGRVHSLPMHIVWLCHINDEMQLTVPGKASEALWAYMDYLWMTHVETQVGKGSDFQLYIRPYLRATWLGGRSCHRRAEPDHPVFQGHGRIVRLARPARVASLPRLRWGGLPRRRKLLSRIA